MGYGFASMKITASNLMVFLLKIRFFNVQAFPDVLLDYCGSDYFAADCPIEHVVLVEEARYGRMELGKCLQIDIGFMGCSSDAIAIMDQWCSGQQSCRFRVRNIGDIHQPCPQEVTNYLQARYSCLKVTIPPNNCCKMPTSNTINGVKGGFLASSIAEDTGCGYAVCPWIIQVPMGQLLNISLHDFGTYNSGLSKNDNTNDAVFGSRCYVYGIITEEATGGTVTICAGNARVKHLYTSVSNAVHIQVVDNPPNGQVSSYFLIEFNAIGCPDPEPPLHAFMEREGSQATIKCFSIDNTYEIECQDNIWQGDLSSCLIPSTTVPTGERNIAAFITDDVFIVFVVAVTFVISVAIITTGVVCLQRHRARLSVKRNATARNMMHMNSLDGAYAAQEFEYNTTKRPHHYHRENYIYYLNKREAQERIAGLSSNTAGENDNGYYSDHTYESPRCEHMQLKEHLSSANTGIDSTLVEHELRTFKSNRDPKENIFGRLHGNELTLPKPTKQSSQETSDGNKTV